MILFVFLNNPISILNIIKIAKANVAFDFPSFFFFYPRGWLPLSSEEAKTCLMRLRLLLAVETELGNWLDFGIYFHVDHCTDT